MGVNNNGSGQTKADAILTKVEQLAQENKTVGAKVDEIINSAVDREMDREAIMQKMEYDKNEVIREVEYLSMQIESSYNSIMKGGVRTVGAAGIDLDELAAKVADKIVIPMNDVDYDALADAVAKKLATEPVDIDYDVLAEKVAERLPARTSDIDYDELGTRVVENMYIPSAVVEELDYDELAQKLAEKVSVSDPVVDYDKLGTKVVENMYIPTAVTEDLDYEELAKKLSENLPAQEVVSADYIASKVAEQLVSPSVDTEAITERIASCIVVPDTVGVSVDEQAIADKVIEKLNLSSVTVDENSLSEKVASAVAASIDGDEIADRIAKQVGTISPEQFDVMVDDDGCDSLAKAVESKLDYDALAEAVAKRLGSGTGADVDAEELARVLSEKLSVTAQVNEDAIADKAAAVLSNYMPEVDTDEIAEKVVSAIPVTQVDEEAIASSVAEKIIEKQEDQDFDIVIDDEGVDRISSSIAERYESSLNKIQEDIEELKNMLSVEDEAQPACGDRLEEIQRDLDRIKAMLAAGMVVAASDEIAPAEAVEEEPVEEVEEEPAEEVVEEEPDDGQVLVTVSDIVDNEPAEESVGEDEDGIEELVDDIDENPAEGEVMPDGMAGGVDFANMMKYNRSFIARIIQGTDDQKRYYGNVKNALLSYKKVNSNISWSNERFNKGRETIARFKIRGKTLCLYLALDPNEFETSVYHQVDVSDNKSMHGTPMMVKIKSPRGCKKAIRLIDIMLERRDGVKRQIAERDYAAMYPYETMEELIEEGLVKDVSKK